MEQFKDSVPTNTVRNINDRLGDYLEQEASYWFGFSVKGETCPTHAPTQLELINLEIVCPDCYEEQMARLFHEPTTNHQEL